MGAAGVATGCSAGVGRPAGRVQAATTRCCAALYEPPEPNGENDKRVTANSSSVQAPALWAWETGNLLTTACRRGRITPAQAGDALGLLQKARVRLEAPPDGLRMRATLGLAQTHGLTFYDASYLEQALRTGAQLASKDAALRRAASKAGVLCLEL